MDDLIKRSDVWNITAILHSEFITIEQEQILERIDEMVDGLPSADRPQGEWKRRLVDNGFNADWVCSECGYRVKTDFVSFNFCPNCGCRMKGADDE